MKKIAVYFAMFLMLLSCCACHKNDTAEKIDPIGSSHVVEPTEPEDVYNEIVISAVGDCTLGRYAGSSYTNSLPYYVEKNNQDYSYFFKNVYGVLSEDDLTIANLEGPLTDATKRRTDKKYAFKGDEEYTNILTSGSVEVVNLANNHSKDYFEEGYQDTITNLTEAGIGYFGNGSYKIIELEGIKIGLVGIEAWQYDDAVIEIDKAVSYFNEFPVDIIIYNFHWGSELHYKHSELQENIAHYAVLNGKANLIIGHHPHVIQGLETYNNTHIAYSLGNFIFGGNQNPRDKHTFIFQVRLFFKNKELIDSKVKIIPAFISGKKNTNDYQPTLANESDSEIILNKIKKSSKNFEYDW